MSFMLSTLADRYLTFDVNRSELAERSLAFIEGVAQKFKSCSLFIHISAFELLVTRFNSAVLFDRA